MIKKFGLSVGSAVAVATVAFAALTGTATATVTTLTATSAVTGGASTVTAVVDAADTVVFEVLGTSTTTGATFAANGGTSIACADGAACDVDTDAGDVAVLVLVPSSSSAGIVNVQALDTDDNIGDDVSITVTSASGAATTVAVTGPTSILNGGTGANATVVTTSATGARVAVTGVTVTVSNGTLGQTAAGVCLSLAAEATEGLPLNNDALCTIDTVTSTTAPAQVGVFESGTVGQNVVVSSFFTPMSGVPTVANLTMVIAGAVSSATIDAPATLEAGATGTITVNAVDSTGNPVAPTAVTVAASEGVVACGALTTTNGSLACTYVAPGSPQNVVVTAVVEAGTTDIVVTDTIVVTGIADDPDDGDNDAGDGEFSGDIADEGVSLVVFGGGSLEDLIGAAEDEDATTISATVDGEFIVYVVGAPDFVNEAFVDEFGGGIDANTAFILFKR